MSILHVSAIQLAGQAGDNLAAMQRMLKKALYMYPSTQLVIFSELCAFGPDPIHAQPMPGPAEETFCAWAKEYGIWLIPGSIFEKDGKNTYNTAPLINPKGEVLLRYRKMYPFKPHEASIEQGTDYAAFDLPGDGRAGLSICYDSWFPETTRTLIWMGAEVIFHPTMTGTIDRDPELSIARASALCNQCWFIDINGAGELGKGMSIVVGPEGDIYHQAGSGSEIIPIEVDFERVRRTRETGLLGGLGQPLKSFRDGPQQFPVYEKGPRNSEVFKKLGDLKKKTKNRE
ncbi:MAG: carbon-nitrogen hydrolase family protein [Verrucomicrobiota bacterium]